MNQKISKRKLNKKKVQLAWICLVISAVTLVSASYAWTMISRTPYVSDLGLTVLSEAYLEIAPDVNGKPGEWDVIYDMSTVLEDVAPLKPVTYSQADNVFYAMSYGTDGRATGADIALTDAKNANVKKSGNASATADGYYIAVTFWVRSSMPTTISLSEAREIEDGLSGTGTYVVGNPVWNGNAVQHEDGGNGLETALRLGFKCQSTDLDCNPVGGSTFYVYEPNDDTHVDGSTGYVETQNKNGTSPLVSSDKLIRQTTSTWNETAPVLSDSVLYTMGEFEDDTSLFDIDDQTYEKVTLYVWLEGQDVDCTNAGAGYETSILANLQLHGSDGVDTGIVRE